MTAPPISPAPARPETGRSWVDGRLHRAGPWLLRGSLAIVLIWFGALKVAGIPTMPGALIAAITPAFLDADLLVRLRAGGAD